MTLPDISKMKSLKLSNSNQLGIVVQDIPKAMIYYSKLLNMGPWYRSHDAETEVFYRGRHISIELDFALTFQGGIEIELIEVKGGEENIYTNLLKQSGGGIHHMGFFVTGYDKKLAGMKEAGIEVIQSGVIKTRGGAVTRFAYFDTVKQCGIITELIETKLMGLLMPHNKFIMHIGCITGDVEKIRI